ncbi:ATP-binding protein [Synechocystis sp. LKSZ1]|uniref:ATP-binding protein n=1 Tax=Synechocystis sp. LKSZ1 TaxID=3144951 RepID=UPI00336C2C40
MANLVSQQDQHLQELEKLAIHTTSQIQAYGMVLVLAEPDLSIVQTSTNCHSLLGISAQQLLGESLESIFDSFQIEPIKEQITAGNLDFINPTKLWARLDGDNYTVFDAVFHRNAENILILELEPTDSVDSISFLSFYHLAKVSINELGASASLEEFCQVIVKEVRQLTGFDRVMLYRFDQYNHGDVIAEDKRADLEPYLGLRYPESDIPQPARRLFIHNPIRLIPDAKAPVVELYPALHPSTEQPLDLTQSILRSASPCHLEYLHNMKVGASLTISLIKDGALWGLIACHHLTPKHVPYELRKACEFLGRVVFADLSAREDTQDYDYRMALKEIQTRLVDEMTTSPDFIEGLMADRQGLLDLTGAQGAALCFGDRLLLLGQTPSESEVKYLLQWLKGQALDDVFFTQSLASLYSDALGFKEVASGLIALPIAERNYLLWFRPEVLQTVNWGGDPSHAFEIVALNNQQVRLSPRKSFERWKETVRLNSLPWKPVEIRAALELKKAIVNIILRQADELAELARDLERSNADLKKFAYVASHDLQEPLNQVANYVQLLEMRYGEQLDEDAAEFINFAVDGVSLMQTLIDDVLAYSKVDVQNAELALTDSHQALDRALANLRRRILENQARITVDPLPAVMADGTQLMQVFQNLIGNALKFRTKTPPEIHVSAQRLDKAWLFSVQDNGIGIDPQFFDRIFVIFQRLHTRDEYSGTGMGLAICKKIIDGHRGQIWVESELGQGSTFFFTIPVGGAERDRRRV